MSFIMAARVWLDRAAAAMAHSLCLCTSGRNLKFRAGGRIALEARLIFPVEATVT